MRRRLAFPLVLNTTASPVPPGVSTCACSAEHARPAGGGAAAAALGTAPLARRLSALPGHVCILVPLLARPLGPGSPPGPAKPVSGRGALPVRSGAGAAGARTSKEPSGARRGGQSQRRAAERGAPPATFKAL